MKAIVFPQFGSPDVLQFKEVVKPDPKEDEILIKVHAASINALDRHLLKSTPALVRIMAGNGFLKPKDQRLGADLAGRVEAVGANVTQFQPGDEVFGVSMGGFAEYACAAEKKVALKPANLSFEAAAAVPVAALTALQGLRDNGQIQPGQKVLISGASGGVGTFAVQIAKAFGAEVTAVCSTRNLEMARSIGADHVIDYSQEDFTRNGQRYDLILAVNGYHPIFAYKRALRPRGRYVLVGEGSNAHLFRAVLQAMLLGPLISRTGGQKMGFMSIAQVNQQDLALIKELIEADKVVPVIDKCYPLGETASAFRYLEEEHAQGKVVITVA
ncbi:MAG TPA: NAD(P)-dependent alcohol dehydrogenase [Ktedonosporobacter sp.]|nr:NAD(P)-dependent alcohol dehydrogenase [Ktedonosporobacter sp.]